MLRVMGMSLNAVKEQNKRGVQTNIIPLLNTVSTILSNTQ
jgi:hypothetical protein